MERHIKASSPIIDISGLERSKSFVPGDIFKIRGRYKVHLETKIGETNLNKDIVEYILGNRTVTISTDVKSKSLGWVGNKVKIPGKFKYIEQGKQQNKGILSLKFKSVKDPEWVLWINFLDRESSKKTLRLVEHSPLRRAIEIEQAKPKPKTEIIIKAGDIVKIKGDYVIEESKISTASGSQIKAISNHARIICDINNQGVWNRSSQPIALNKLAGIKIGGHFRLEEVIEHDKSDKVLFHFHSLHSEGFYLIVEIYDRENIDRVFSIKNIFPISNKL